MKIQKSEVKSQKSGASNLAVGLAPCSLLPSPARRERGIALVITLIMLSVTLIMAVAFLALSRRERSAVATTTDTAAARLAADAALAAAQAQIAANIFNTNQAGVDVGAYDYHLLVSTNYINPLGYVPAIPTSPTNVNYDYRYGGGALNGADLVQNVANLFYLPRVPVYVSTNSGSPLDFRFYLDLNRNGKFETNGVITEFDNNNLPIGTAFHVGDPEWVGLLERPDQPHSANNHFVARYAFLAQPIGNALDLNFIHNQTRNPNLTAAQDGYFRNEGVGSWELNLAAFLTDLNTNQWNTLGDPYTYQQPNGIRNLGRGFEDAFSLLAYRYGYTYNSLAVPPLYFYNALVNGGIDGYTLGNLMTGTALPAVAAPLNAPNSPWAGSDNTNRFFALPSELFDVSKSSVSFTNSLTGAGNSTNTYDRYTLYRLLDQLGTDSTADDGKMNLNYRNITNGVVVASLETNAYPWTPLEFFTNAANRLLTNSTTAWLAANFNAYTNTFGATVTNFFGVASIPVYVNGQFVYSPAVNRLLQLAANIYDATTNSPWPSVFRPLFSRVGTNVFITGYTNLDLVSGTNDPAFFPPLNVSAVATGGGTNVLENVYGVPWILGAKKGLPNFNEFSMINNLAVTRRLQFIRTTNTFVPVITCTNQMYTMSLSSTLGVELWNSYTNNYPWPVQIVVNEAASLTITNDDPGFQNHPGIAQPMIFSTNVFIATNNWSGTTPWYGGNPNSSSFILPLNLSLPMMTNSVYRSPYAGLTPGAVPAGLTAPCLIPTNYFSVITPPTTVLFESNSPNGFHLPQFGVLLTNRLQCYVLAVTNGLYHVIDYVHFAGPDSGFNVNSNLADPDLGDNVDHAPGTGVWNTNYPPGSSAPNGPTYGIINQIAAAKSGTVPAEDGIWHADPDAATLGGTIAQQAASFTAFFKPGSKFGNVINPRLSVQAPYSPTRNVMQYFTWQANDPLVHYLTSDISVPTPNTSAPEPGVSHTTGAQINFTNLPNLGQLNDLYMPWGGNPNANLRTPITDTNRFNLAERDPLAYGSDNWDFPTNKYPTVGWLGRVHRGTPWQTVYLKATNLLATTGINAWTSWTGDFNLFDASNTVPVLDSQLFDLFGTAPNGNATHGTLSVNVGAGSTDPQAGLAAWSAVFGGLVVPTNTAGGYVIFPPAGASGSNSYLGQIVASINATRTNANLFPAGVFTHVGDVLRVPALAEQSPFLSGIDPTTGISDELYEWLPQQTLGLLRLSSTPRYVIYCYGQALRPAANSIVTSSTGGQFGLCTNYQVMAESAARAVIRFDRIVFTNATGTVTGTNYKATVESYNVLPPN